MVVVTVMVDVIVMGRDGDGIGGDLVSDYCGDGFDDGDGDQ